MAKLSLSSFCAAALLAVCVWNAGRSLQRSFHWPVLVEDEWTRVDRRLERARTVLGSLPDSHIDYRIEEATETYDIGAYYRLQYMLAPTILPRLSDQGRFVLVEFWSSRTVKPLPGLTLVEDLGSGLGLYRRP